MGLKGAGRGREFRGPVRVGRRGVGRRAAGDVGIARRVDGDRLRLVTAAPAQVGGVCERRADHARPSRIGASERRTAGAARLNPQAAWQIAGLLSEARRRQRGQGQAAAAPFGRARRLGVPLHGDVVDARLRLGDGGPLQVSVRRSHPAVGLPTGRQDRLAGRHPNRVLSRLRLGRRRHTAPACRPTATLKKRTWLSPFVGTGAVCFADGGRDAPIVVNAQ